MEVLSTDVGLDVSSFEFINELFVNYHLSHILLSCIPILFVGAGTTASAGPRVSESRTELFTINHQWNCLEMGKSK